MAIENTYLLGKNITLGCGFDLQAKAPLDSRQTVPAFAGLQALIDNNAAYEGMIVYDEETKKTYQALIIEDVLQFREFGLTSDELKDLITSETTAAMEFKGAATALPENPAKGDMYKVTTAFKVGEEDAKIGDSIVYDGEQWFIIPSGDDIEDTWRPVTGVDNDSALTFVAGDKLEKTVAADGTITYKHVAIDAPTNMNEEGDEQTRTYITQLITDNHGHVIGFKTATENVEDTNTTYTFEGQSDEATSVYFQVKSSDADAAEVIYIDAYSKNEADAAIKEVSDVIDNNKATWDLAGTAVQTSDFNTFKNDNTQAIADAVAPKLDTETFNSYIDGKSMSDEDLKKYADDAAAAVDTKLTQYGEAHASDYTNEQIDKAIEDATGALGTMSTKDANDYFTKDETATKIESYAYATKEYTDAELAKKVDKESYAADKATFATKTELGDVDKKFADYKTAADQKVIDDAQDVEIAKKVDKVEGKDLIATSEIERLATLKNYDDTALAGRVTTAEGKITALETESAKHALKTDVEAVDEKFADYTKTADLPTDLGDFTNNAGYAKTADVNTELDKKADKTQVATDIANAIAPLATTEALNGVKATAEAATTVEEVDAQIDAKIGALNLGTTYEPIGAEDRAKAYVDGKFTDANLDQYTTEAEVKSIVDGVIAGAADSETYNSLTKLVDYIDAHGGEASEMAQAIETLEGDVKGLKEAPSAGIKASDIEAWNGEIGAKALAETKTTTAEVKAQIEAYGYATTGELAAEKAAREAKEAELAAALATAKTEAANQDAVVLAESQAYTDAAKADAIADAEGKVNALAEGAVATNAGNIETLFEMFQWGEF